MVRLPSTRVNDMLDSNPLATFGHLVRELNRMRIGYLHVMEPDANDLATGLVEIRETTRTFRAMFDQTVLTNVGYSCESGNAVLASGVAVSPSGPAFGVAHVLRGGGWMSRPRDTRVTVRSWGSLNEAGPNVGFRCAKE